MSWDSYIDNLLGHGQGHADKAAIIGLDGGAPWTTVCDGKGLVFQGTEAQVIAAALKSRDFTPLQASGIRVEGVKYQYLREEDGKIVLGKKKDEGAITCQASASAVVIAHTKEGQQQGNVNKAVAVIAEYLESLGM